MKNKNISFMTQAAMIAAIYVVQMCIRDRCERGVRTFESYTRNTLDLQSIPVIQKLSHLPIIIDPRCV